MNKTMNKWVVGAASAALVASAIVPVASAASFSDIEKSDHKDAILALAEAGIVSGYTDGTFKPNAVVTRGNVTKFLGKWLVEQGYEIPADFDKVARFDDLSTTHGDQELVKFAALVKDAKVFNGSNNNLMHTNNMNREQMALVLVRAINTVYGVDLVAEYKAANFESKITDLEKATADENREAIIALEYAELTNVTAFNPKNSLTRGQFASFLNRAITNIAKEEVQEVKVESVTAVNGTLTVKLAEKAEAVEVKDFTVTQAINGGTATEVTPSAAVLSEDGLTVTLTVDKVAAQETTEQSVVYTVNEVAAPAFVVEATTLAVSSVDAINGTQVKVVFNKEVDETSAENEANYKINGTALNTYDASAEATLAEDNKTVTITFSTHKDKTSFNLQVVGVADKADTTKTITSEQFLVTVADTEAPSVTSVKYVGNDIIIEFSEPVANPTTVIARIDGKPVATVQGTKTNEVKLEAATLTSAGVSVAANATVPVYVANAKDAVGNTSSIYNGTVTKPTADTTKPTVSSITPVAQDTIRVVFSEKIASAPASSAISLLSGATVLTHAGGTGVTYTVSATADDTTGTSYDVKIDLDGTTTTGDAIFTDSTTSRTFTLLLAADAVADEAGNKNDAYTGTFTLTKDVIGPVLKSSKLSTDGKTFELTFDENITKAALANIVVTDATGVRHAIQTGTPTDKITDVSGKVLTVDITDTDVAPANGTYTIKVPAGVVKDAYGNNNAESTVTLVVGNGTDTTAPTVTIGGTANSFTATFNKEVTSETALLASNYKLDGAALPTGTDIYFTDSTRKTVAIVLPEGSINFGKVGTGTSAVLEVSGVKDKTGNVVKTTSDNVTIQDNTSATLQTVQVLGNDIYLTFNEAMDATTVAAINDATTLAADFEIKVGGETLNLGTLGTGGSGGTAGTVTATVLSNNNKQVKITITPQVDGSGYTGQTSSNWDPSSTISVKVKGATIKDANLFVLKAGTAVIKTN